MGKKKVIICQALVTAGNSRTTASNGVEGYFERRDGLGEFDVA